MIRIEEASIQSRFHPQRAAEQLINRTPEAYRFDYGGQPLDLLYDMVTYKGNNDQTLVEFAYSVPTRQLGTVEDGQVRATLRGGTPVYASPHVRQLIFKAKALPVSQRAEFLQQHPITQRLRPTHPP